MAGIYGSDPEDRYFEQQLMDYLDDECEPVCEGCEEYEKDCVCEDEE